MICDIVRNGDPLENTSEQLLMRCACDPLLVRRFLTLQETPVLLLRPITGLPEGAAIALSRDLPAFGSARESIFTSRQRSFDGQKSLEEFSLEPSQFEPSLDDHRCAFDLYMEEPHVAPGVRFRVLIPVLFGASGVLFLLLLSLSI
jgi:hypothetical protein